MAKNSPDYIITTNIGCIPYIIDTDKEYLKKPKKIYLDDILYKDSFYDKSNKCPIRTFIGIEEDVYLAFRNKANTLSSKRGNYKLKQVKYEELVKELDVTGYADFKTGNLRINSKSPEVSNEFEESEIIQEPKNLEDFRQKLKDGVKYFGTEFINKMVEDGLLLKIDETGDLKAEHINQSNFEYQKYLFSINEMNAFTFISENNYKIFHDYFCRMKEESKCNK